MVNRRQCPRNQKDGQLTRILLRFYHQNKSSMDHQESEGNVSNLKSGSLAEFPDMSKFSYMEPVDWRRGQVPRRREISSTFYHHSQVNTKMIALGLPQRNLWLLTWKSVHWENVQTFLRTVGPSVKLTLIPGVLKHHYSLSLRVRVYENQVISEFLAKVLLTVSLQDPQTHLVIISQVLEYIIGINILGRWHTTHIKSLANVMNIVIMGNAKWT